jgi:hypothetical protein
LSIPNAENGPTSAQMKIVKYRATWIKRSGLLSLATVAPFATRLQAQHYPAGSEGVNAGSLPASGYTIEDDNSFYYSDRMTGFAGQLSSLNRFDYIQTPRFTWMSDWKILAANYGVSVRVPFAYQQITYSVPSVPPPSGGAFPVYPGSPTKSITDSKFGLSDIEVQPLLLAWHFVHFDFSTGYSFWCPTGDYNKYNGVAFSLGQGYWTHSFMLGITWYPDANKTWAISILNHYDINSEQYNSQYSGAGGTIVSQGTTLGDIYTLE